MATKSSSLIRWAGSKNKLVSNLTALMPPVFNRYYEPFIGSGCLFFSLNPNQAVIGDINPHLISFYHEVRDNTQSVYRGAVAFRRTKEDYYRLRAQYNLVKDQRKRASIFLYLNRFCFNGIYRTNKAGEFNVPYGEKTGGFPKQSEFLGVSKQLKRAKIKCSDFEETIATASKGDFVYLDPPYMYSKHRDRGEYGPGSFRLTDLQRLKKIVNHLDQKGVMFLLSYVDCEEIREIGAQYRQTTIPVKRCVASLASKRITVDEVVIKNF